MKKNILIFFLLIGFCEILNAQTERITVMTYNLLNYSNPANTDALGNDAARAGYFTQIVEAADADVILVQELTSTDAADQLLASLNTNGTLGKTYNRATAWNPATGFGNMLFYNDDLMDLVAQNALPQANTMVAPSGNTQTSVRIVCEFIMNVVNPNCAAQFTEVRFYDQHLKASQDEAAGTSIADRDRRDLGCKDLMDHVNTLAPTINVIAAGDFNFYSDNSNPAINPEPGYTTLTSATNANPLIDVLGGWVRNTASEVSKYTQSTRDAIGTDAFGNGGANGGLDDRFDLIFFNGAVNNNTNFVGYVAGSYQVFGNVSVPLNGQVDSGSSALATTIMRMSDHYPVILDLDVTFNPANACVDCAPKVKAFPVN